MLEIKSRAYSRIHGLVLEDVSATPIPWLLSNKQFVAEGRRPTSAVAVGASARASGHQPDGIVFWTTSIQQCPQPELAMVLGDKLTAAQCNFVHQDQIW